MKSKLPSRNQVHQFKETARVDPYRTDMKPKGPIQCKECKSVSIKGRWLPLNKTKFTDQFGVILNLGLCPACQQLRDHYAMGVIELSGKQYESKKSEIIGNLRNLELIARRRNDQHRILWMNEQKKMTKVYVSLPELARGIGRSLERSFQGKTEYIHSNQEPFLRVRWKSDLPHFKHKIGTPFVAQYIQTEIQEKQRVRGKSNQLRKRGQEK